MRSEESVLKQVQADFRRAWKQLLATDLAYKILAFVVLTPLSALVLQALIRFSGQKALSDQDILFFFLRPVGWLTLIVAGGIIVGIVAMELAALMLIGFGATEDREVRVGEALAVTLHQADRILRVTARMIGRILAMAAPFLAVVGVTYLVLLTRHDINYYLTLKPAEFWLAVGIAVVTVAILAAVLLRMVSGWLYAVPLLLFEGVAPSQALAESSRRTAGHRWWIARWIVAWALFAAILSAVVTGPIGFLGRLLLPWFAESLTFLVPMLGLVTVLLSLANLAVNVVVTVAFGLLLVSLYRRKGDRGAAKFPISAADFEAGKRARLRFTKGRVVGAAVVAVAVAALVGGLILSRVSFEDNTRVTAHRGASGAAPENTMAAVERAITDGADFVEIDVQETLDGVVVVAHDSDFMKVANDSTKIWEASLEHLQGLDIGSWFGPEFTDQRVPTLAEVLDACKDKVKVNIELKYYGHDESLEERVVELVEERDMASDVVIMSLKLKGVEKVQAMRPDWTVGLLSAVALGDLTEVDVDFLAVSSKLATPFFIRAAHKTGKEVYVWTVNDVVGMSTYLSRGVDSLITDEPAQALEVMAQRAELSSPERLLVELAALFGLSSDKEMTEADA
jgi:glycerophosphoryl diester phosphodiesterase